MAARREWFTTDITTTQRVSITRYSHAESGSASILSEAIQISGRSIRFCGIFGVMRVARAEKHVCTVIHVFKTAGIVGM